MAIGNDKGHDAYLAKDLIILLDLGIFDMYREGEEI